MYEILAKVQAKILIPLFTAQSKSLVNQTSIDDMSKYNELKEFLLTEYKLDLKRLSKVPVRRILCLPLGYVICCRITSKVVWLRITKL